MTGPSLRSFQKKLQILRLLHESMKYLTSLQDILELRHLEGVKGTSESAMSNTLRYPQPRTLILVIQNLAHEQLYHTQSIAM
jgi:hypothetical protein